MNHNMTVENQSNSPKVDLLTSDVLNSALKNDLGQEWNLQSFTIDDIMKKGNNYMSAVNNVCCIGISCDKVKKTYYVAKVNPQHPTTAMDYTLNDLFKREGLFLSDVAPQLNDILRELDCPQINFPECVYFNSGERKEILISKDLCKQGFKMKNNEVDMDYEHALLIIKELAKLHASSVILQNRLDKNSILDVYPILQDTWMENESSLNMFHEFYRNNMLISLNLSRSLKEYEEHSQWLENLTNQFITFYKKLLKTSPENLRVLCHGDCWTSNILFRYDDKGSPEDIAVLDLQLCRFGSLALDLNNFFFTSLPGVIRRQHYDDFLTVYYQEFRKIITSANTNMPFTEEELRTEMLQKTIYGVINGLASVPVQRTDDREPFDFGQMKEGEEVEYMERYNRMSLKMLDKSPKLKQDLLSILDDAFVMGIMTK